MQTRTMVLVSGVALAAILLAAGGCQATRAGYETAPYRVIRSEGAFQLRDYPALQWVETPMGTEGKDSDGSFGRLFRFITGGNEAKQKIAMTTPVFMSGDGTNALMAFVMPAKLKSGDVPKPKDEKVRVRASASEIASPSPSTSSG